MLGKLRSGAQKAVRPLGYELVKHDFYSPLPDIGNLSPDLWNGPQDLPGIELQIEDAVRLLDRDLRPYIAEFDPPRTADAGCPGYYRVNGGYGLVDAEILYSMIRNERPARIIELGSGASSHVIAMARAANALESYDCRHVVFDPFPFSNPMGPVEVSELHRQRAEDIPLDVFSALGAGDILFIDTTHTVKTGGDVTSLILGVLPRLASGVVVHVHDIFLPYEYPAWWIIDLRWAWAEQYLLQAFLAFNPTYEVIFPAHAVTRSHPDLVADAVPAYEPSAAPGAFWMRKR
jgi:hypothetical protein